MARATRSQIAGLLLLSSLVTLAACSSDDPGDPEPNTQFLAVRRAWRPGERDSTIAAIVGFRSLNVPGVGDLSDYASLMLSPDSTSDIIPNPNYVHPTEMSPFGPTFSLSGVRVPGTGWTSTGLDVALINTGPGDDTNWLGVFWYLDSDPTRKGIINAATTSLTYPTTTVNTQTFDAAFGLSGVGAAEVNTATNPDTYYENRGEGGTYRVIATTISGGFSTVTSGPFTGGTLRTGTQNEVITNVVMTRRSGSGSPTSVTASLSGTITAWELTCTFPSPCTTNVPGVAEAAKRGPLPDSLYAKLPWIRSLAPPARAIAMQRYAMQRSAALAARQRPL